MALKDIESHTRTYMVHEAHGHQQDAKGTHCIHVVAAVEAIHNSKEAQVWPFRTAVNVGLL